MALRKRTRRILTTLLVLIALVVVGWLALPLLLEPVIRAKLSAATEAHLGAKLLIGKIEYDFPYGVRAHDVRLKRLDDDGEMFSAPLIGFSLVELPIRSGPLQIERIVMEQPTVRLIRRSGATSTPQAPVAAPQTGAAPQVSAAPQAAPATEKAPMKLSDLFRLRELAIHRGSVRYEQGRKPDDAVVWENINTDLRLTPMSGSLYGWDFTADSGAAGDVAAAGTIDIDQLVLDVKQLAVNARATPDASSALPAQFQNALRRFDVRGVARLEASARLVLRNLDRSQFNSTIHLDDIHAKIGGQPVQSTLAAVVSRKPDSRWIDLSTPAFRARIGDGTVLIHQAAGQVDPNARAWRMIDLAAAIDDITVKPPGFAEPVEHLKGAIHVSGGQLVAQNVTAQIRNDLCTLNLVRGQFTDDGGLELRDIDLAMRFARPSARYNWPIERVLAPLDPSGDFTIRGRYTFVPAQRDDFELVITTAGGELRVGKKRVPITNVRGEAAASPKSVVVRRVLGSVFEGSGAASGVINTSARPIEYNGDLSFQQLDVAAIAATYFPGAAPGSLTGRCDATLSIQGQGNAPDTIVANGEMRITEGHLWELPLIQRVVTRIKLAKEALTAGEAAAIFGIADARIQLRRAALNSPALGLQGSGTIGFDGQLDLEVTAAPLGDWERHIKSTGLPFVSDLAGNFVGVVQRAVSAATNQLLFQFKVTGTHSDPRIETVPSPIITEHAAQLLAKMIRRDVNLLDALKEKK